MRLLTEIYKTIIDFVIDLRSTRIMLIWVAVGLFMWSVIRNVDPVNLGIVAGLLSTVFYFYFKSKEQEHKKPEVIQTVYKNIDPDQIEGDK